jgi:hypothetical protein
METQIFKLALNLDALCTGLDALKNLVTFNDKLALPLFFSNSRPVSSIQYNKM